MIKIYVSDSVKDVFAPDFLKLSHCLPISTASILGFQLFLFFAFLNGILFTNLLNMPILAIGHN